MLWWKQHATCFSTFVATLGTAAVHALLPCEAALPATTTCHTLIIVLDKATQMLLLCCAAGSAAGQACCSSSAGHGRCQTVTRIKFKNAADFSVYACAAAFLCCRRSCWSSLLLKRCWTCSIYTMLKTLVHCCCCVVLQAPLLVKPAGEALLWRWVVAH